MTPLFVALAKLVEDQPIRRQKWMYGAMLLLFIAILAVVANLDQ